VRHCYLESAREFSVNNRISSSYHFVTCTLLQPPYGSIKTSTQLNSTLFIILQPKGWIKNHTIIAEEHKVKTIMQYNKNINTSIEHHLLQNYSK